jgi:hypothetical protein
LKRHDPQVYRTDVLCEFADPESAMLPSDLLEANTRSGPEDLPPQERQHYVAAMDPATRGNAWTLVVLTRHKRDERMRWAVAACQQWLPKHAPEGRLSADFVLGEVAITAKRYGVKSVSTDQWAADPLTDLGRHHGLHLTPRIVTSKSKVAAFETMRGLLDQGLLELSPNRDLQQDLRQVRKRVTQQGISVVLPETSDGRHADYAAALSLALGEPCRDPTVPNKELDAAWAGWSVAERAEAERLDAELEAAANDDTGWLE